MQFDGHDESETFSDSSLHHICESENFRLPFSTKNSVTWEVKREKLTSENRRELFRSFENCTRIRGTQRRFPPGAKYVKNTFYAIQSGFGTQEIRSKRRYKICIYSVILGDF